MEQALVLHNPHWRGEKYAKLYNRTLLKSLLDKLDLREIQVLLGVRRSGKSTIYKLLINDLIKRFNPKSILFVNCEDPFFSSIWSDSANLYRLVESAERITGVRINYLFLDEIQQINGWEKYIKSMYEVERFTKIFITGSNSDLLEGDYIKLLSGRYIADKVFPLTLSEYFEHNDIHSRLDVLTETVSVQKIIDTMLYFGSFPEVIKIQKADLKRQLLLNYYETTVIKDCLMNNNIRDFQCFRNLGMYLFSNIGTVYSYNSLAKAIGSNENTVQQYIRILERCFVMREIRNFSFSVKVNSRPKNKIYCCDNGLISAVSLSFSSNKGKMFENLVFTELYKMEQFEIFLFNERNECDFILKKDTELIAIQAVYELNENNRKRETAGLQEAMSKFKIEKGYIVTFNQSDKIDETEVISFVEMMQKLSE